jgi:hypothetical protein
VPIFFDVTKVSFFLLPSFLSLSSNLLTLNRSPTSSALSPHHHKTRALRRFERAITNKQKARSNIVFNMFNKRQFTFFRLTPALPFELLVCVHPPNQLFL